MTPKKENKKCSHATQMVAQHISPKLNMATAIYAQVVLLDQYLEYKCRQQQVFDSLRNSITGVCN